MVKPPIPLNDLQLHESDNRRSFNNFNRFNLSRNPFSLLNKKEMKIEKDDETKNQSEEIIIKESESEND